MKKLQCVLFVLMFGVLLQANSPLLEDEKNTIEVYKKAHPAVVFITTVTLKSDFFQGVIPESGVGTGVLIDDQGHIVTNHHVIGTAKKIAVTLHDKTMHTGKVIGKDADTDLAVIKIPVKGKKLPYLKFADPSKLQVGQKALAIGNPFGLTSSLSKGIISSLNREIQSETGRSIKDVIQTDAAVNRGNSGGPLLNSAAEIIGINSQIFSLSGGNVGIAFAISVGTVTKIVNQLLEHGEVFRPWLGLSAVELPAPILHELGARTSHGVMVTRVFVRSPSARAGLRAAEREIRLGLYWIPADGDIIYQVDDQKVRTLEDLRAHIFNKKKGEKVELHFFRQGKKLTKSISLDYPPRIKRKSM